jgi:hypothetical protein
MSISAHRIIEIKYAESSSFNLDHNKKLFRFLDDDMEITDKLSTDGSGMVDIPVSKLERAVKIAKKLELDEDTVKQIQQDINFARTHHNESVLYDCF